MAEDPRPLERVIGDARPRLAAAAGPGSTSTASISSGSRSSSASVARPSGTEDTRLIRSRIPLSMRTPSTKTMGAFPGRA